ncbi:TRAP transporter, membrane-spanning component [Aeropyrum pernix]|uniref:TRAP transporter, membrane-spanning component n=1 Tax=Aeropyrum pernix TaxID=56636 RepID=A0A401HC28_AERPX|nr:TRAP transporter large permease subunit [Aeropyrum pernix]GBF09973.1 TRAP transporter, membrane-spanning component [Aeropyrum pernix]
MKRPKLSAENIYIIASLFFTVALLYYYYTGLGGPILLATVMVPYTVFLTLLALYTKGGPISKLPRAANAVLVLLSLIAAITVSGYIVTEFRELNTVRMGSYNTLDIIVGGAAFALVMFAALLKYRAIFILNVLLLIYTLNGSWAPYPFDHPGIRLERIITAMSVEFETGVFEKLSQLALTLIGAFMLFISIAQAFGAVDSVIRLVIGALGSRPRLLPQAAVVGSMVIAMVSGSGAANAASTGSITIPLMKKAGMRPVKAAAIETASSIGGQLMPPIMGISAFVMADYLGVSYFDVVARGWAPALIYYIGLAAAVYLASKAFLSGTAALNIGYGRLEVYKAASLMASILLLIILMGARREYPAYAALQSSILLLALLAAAEASRGKSLRGAAGRILARLAETLKIFSGFVADITILLAALGVMTGLMTITGIPTRVGFLLLEVGASNKLLLVTLAFVFGYLVGLGLPPVVTYILTVVVIGPYMLQAGFNPWAVHFYAFLLGVMSELSPPTSVTAAVTSRIAGAGFVETMVESIKFAIPLFTVMAGVLLEPGLVAEPGISQLLPAAKVLVATIAVVAGLGSEIHIATRIALVAAGIAILVIL